MTDLTDEQIEDLAIAVFTASQGPSPMADKLERIDGIIRSALSNPAPGAGQQEAMTDERPEFEAWIRSEGGDPATYGIGATLHYSNSAVDNAWTGWRARAGRPHPVEAQQAAGGGEAQELIARLYEASREAPTNSRLLRAAADALASRAAPAAPAVEAVTDGEIMRVAGECFADENTEFTGEMMEFARAVIALALARKGGG